MVRKTCIAFKSNHLCCGNITVLGSVSHQEGEYTPSISRGEVRGGGWISGWSGLHINEVHDHDEMPHRGGRTVSIMRWHAPESGPDTQGTATRNIVGGRRDVNAGENGRLHPVLHVEVCAPTLPAIIPILRDLVGFDRCQDACLILGVEDGWGEEYS